MGITIYAKNSTYNFDMGCGSFFNLRKNIATILNNDFGEHYSKLIYCHSKQDFEEHDRIANELIEKHHLDEDILNFLYMSDCEGKVSYRTCKKIYDLIKDVDFNNKVLRYVAYSHNDYEEFKLFLKECFSYRRNMIWN